MLITYHSNRLESLVDQLVRVISKPLQAPLAPECIVVQSNGMARWLALQLAERLGICSNVRFPFPAAFLWDICRLTLNNVPEESPCQPMVLTWRLMDMLKHLEELPRFKPLQAYLQDHDDFRCYELASRIARTFDQYLVYRPDWIKRWETGQDKHWQAELWRRLAPLSRDHRVHVQQRFFDATLKLTEVAQLDLPERVSLMGISAMPPVYLDMFSRLSQVMDIHLYLLNPCREYWGDIVAERDIARQGTDVDAAEEYLTVGNNLLASLGKQGRDFVDLLQNYPCAVVECFQEPEGESLLQCLQEDILDLRNRGDDDFPATPILAQDRSIQVHACHSFMREVEVLYDQLLALFHEHPDLRPADVIVMTPDIEAYAPAIEAVFGTTSPDRRIPFSIADQSLCAENALLDAFFSLLEVSGSRFDANRVLALLEVPAVQRRFGFAEGDLLVICRWVKDTGIRWGIDQHSRLALDLPATREHTWRAGLDRLLLGYALPGGNRQLLGDILPYDEVEGGDTQIMARLHTFAEALFQLNAELVVRQSLIGWCETLSGVLERFLAPVVGEEKQLQMIYTALEKISHTAAQARYTDSVSLAVVKSCLRAQLETAEGSAGRFITGGVTFSAMVPMRSIPFQVVCLLGMNSTSYPRPRRSLGFDLMTRNVRRGDRSRRNDDRYLFLEALLSARRCFYLSFVGNDIRDNSLLPPSVLVSELLDYIERGFYHPDGEALRESLVVRHPLQSFSRRYFMGDNNLFSYSEEMAAASQAAGRGKQESVPFVSCLPPPEEVWRALELSQLIRFFANPARYLLQQRLALQLEENEGQLTSREPFVLDRLNEQTLRQTMLTLQRSGLSAAEMLPVLQSGGVLPHGQVGKCVFVREWEDLERFVGQLDKTMITTQLEPLQVDLCLSGIRLTGWLTGIRQQGLVDYRIAKLRAQDYLDVWIRHLLLNWLAPDGVRPVSHWLGKDQEFILRPVANPEYYLARLLEHYWEGLQRPLPFFPKSALAYVKKCFSNSKKKLPPEEAARHIWEGNEQQRGEREDLYYRLAFRGSQPLDEEFYGLAAEIFAPLLEHLQE